MAATDLLVMHGVHAQLNTTPSLETANWEEFGEGWTNLTEILNEVKQQYQFMNNGGFGKSFITGMQPACQLTGVRVLDDPVQNYLFATAQKYGILSARNTDFRIQFYDGDDELVTILYEDATFNNLQAFGGAMTDGAAITADFDSNGIPTVSGGTLIGALTVVSVAGSAGGDTAIYVNPALTNGNTYVYKTAPSVTMPDYGDTLTTGWTAWNGTADITATTGNEIVIAEIDGSNLAEKAGKATVTANS